MRYKVSPWLNRAKRYKETLYRCHLVIVTFAASNMGYLFLSCLVEKLFLVCVPFVKTSKIFWSFIFIYFGMLKQFITRRSNSLGSENIKDSNILVFFKVYLTQRKRTFKCNLNPNEALERSPHLEGKASQFTGKLMWSTGSILLWVNKNGGMVSRKSRHLSISLINGWGIDLMQILRSNVLFFGLRAS